MNWIKVGCHFINDSAITHVTVHDDAVTVYFVSSDFNKESDGHPSLRLTGDQAKALIEYLCACSISIKSFGKVVK